MIAALIGRKAIYKIRLPQNPVGSYWITAKIRESERKLVNIEGKNGIWQVVNSNNAKIINIECIDVYKEGIKVAHENYEIGREIELEEYKMYGVVLENTNELFLLYCFPTYDTNLFHLNIKNQKELFIGNGLSNNSISYNNKFMEKMHARMFFSNGRWIIENYDKKFGIFVNNVPIYADTKMLQNGDVIFILGLKIVIMGNTIFINNPENRVVYNKKDLELIRTRGQPITIKDISEEDQPDYIEDNLEEKYFYRAPRISSKIESETVKIDAPPALQAKDETPAILVMGSMLSMGVVMMVSMFSSIDGLLSGQSTLKSAILAIIVSLAMLTSIILFPILNRKYEKKKKEKHEKKRQDRYREYINSKMQIINNIMGKQRKILLHNYTSTEECEKIVLEQNSRLWERKIEDHDFISVRLGIGEVPLKINIQYPEEKFQMEDDNLLEMLNEIGRKSKTLKDAPVTISLAERNILGLIIQDDKNLEKLMQNIIMQLITFQSYDNLKIVCLLNEDKQKKWEYLKMIPHLWDDTKQMRFFADNYSDMIEISKFLEKELNARKNRARDNSDYKEFAPYYLIITDDYKQIEGLKIISELLKCNKNFGFSILSITDNIMQLPNECKTFINIENNRTGVVFENELSSSNQKEFMLEEPKIKFFEQTIKTLANIPIKYNASRGAMLPNIYTFLEMYDVGIIEQLNIYERWNRSDATLSIKAPIGIDSLGTPIALDIHEAFHGPHGLIAGSTGSGKSEFIITYILSLAINYHPDDVTFMLIDYKGGGLAGAFEKREVKLPHLVGTITNIDTAGLQRSLDSIQSELRRRQIMFNEARNLTDESTIDIYKYQKLYHEGIVNKPIPHLLIICDEFAELKQQQEEFMDELISVARIGRSLGVHLILATQKPAGIVNEQIRSNSKFAICLKVQDRSDSNDVIKKPLAADLKRAGQFYLQVGNDEYFVLGQSAWAGAPYYPSDLTQKKIDNSIDFISNIGTIIKKVDDGVAKVVNSQGDQLTNIVKYMYELAKENNIKAEQLWLENIPETIYIDKLRNKYHKKAEENNINPIIGEYDDPFNQRQGVVTLPLTNGGNTIIYGNADSGKETLVNAIVYDTMKNHSVNEVQMYLLDFGSEALKIFNKAPHVGDVVFINEREKVSRYFEMMQKEIQDRRKILSEYNGSYKLYLEQSTEPMPMIVTVINNYEAFAENYENEYEDILQTITREGVKYGIVFIITASTYHQIRYRLSQNFKQKITLQLNNEDDYLNIFEKLGKKRPSKIFGRGLVRMEDQIYEFQTAKITEPEKWNSYIQEFIKDLNSMNKVKAKHIPITPETVSLEDVKEALKDVSNVPLGIDKEKLDIYTYNFKKNFLTVITGKNMEYIGNFIVHLVEVMKLLKNTEITVIDAEKILETKKTNINEQYNKFISEIGTKTKHQICFIIGIEKFLNDTTEDLSEVIKRAREEEKYSFVIVDNANRIKNHSYEGWYKNNIMEDNGIWIGNGIDDQYVISVSTNRRDLIGNCGASFGYAIKEGEASLIKLVGVKEKGDAVE